MPNTFAYLMLALWPVITLVIFHRLPAGKALIWSILLAYLFLPPQPTAFDFPLLPPFNKLMISHLSVVLALFVLSLRNSAKPAPVGVLHRGIEFLPKSPLMRALVLVFILSPVLTVLANPEPLVFQRLIIPGLRVMDAVALSITQALLLIGYLLARQFLREAEAQRNLLLALLFSGLFYAWPMLLEVRLSPQINLWVYGFFQHEFGQMIRGGGFRPIVFLPHGIWAAFFVMSCVIAALGLWKADRSETRIRLLIAAVFLGVVLVLSKTLGALLFASLLVPVLLLTGFKTQIRLAAILGLLAFSYPALKGAGLIPVQTMLTQAEKIDPDRAGSLRFRFVNEDELYARALEKPLVGWGSWGRNQLRDEVTGEITSVSDGRWIIVLGEFGWLGFLAEFGLLAFPLLLIWRETRGLSPDDISPWLGPVALLLGVNLIDMLPNATLTPLTWLMAGALLGHAEKLRVRRRKSELSAEEFARQHPRTII